MHNFLWIASIVLLEKVVNSGLNIFLFVDPSAFAPNSFSQRPPWPMHNPGMRPPYHNAMPMPPPHRPMRHMRPPGTLSFSGCLKFFFEQRYFYLFPNC